MAERFVITGKKILKGELEVRGAKNAAFPLLAASLLTKDPCYVYNLPLIEDVFRMLNILTAIGAEIKWLSNRDICIKCKDIDLSRLPYDIITRLRGSVVLLGPLLARFGRIKFPPPGGCIIGARPIDTHIDVFSQMGVNLTGKNRFFYFDGKPKPAKIILREFSVTATENAILGAALSSKPTLIYIADIDYPISELIRALKIMGVRAQGVGTHYLKITGRKNLKGFRVKLISDPIEAGTFIALSLATKSKLLIKNIETHFLELFFKRLTDFGARFKFFKNSVLILPSGLLKMDKIQSMPFPGLHTDLQPELGVLATQSKGPTLIHDPLYEGRLKYLEELNKMGASIIFCDPHRAIVNGPTELEGKEILSLDIRSGIAFLIAGLVAKGQTILHNIYQIDRGYERVEERLQSVGADIKRVKD